MPERKPHLYLTGYRGTGKSSVARLLANSLGLPSRDTDRLIEERAGCSIRQIFAEQGEAEFRDLEAEALATVADLPQAVIALGGGAILRSENRVTIRSTGCCVWLTAAPTVLWQRIQADQQSGANRPALTSHTSGLAEIQQILADREPLYRATADLEVATDGRSLAAVAASVADWWRTASADIWQTR